MLLFSSAGQSCASLRKIDFLIDGFLFRIFGICRSEINRATIIESFRLFSWNIKFID